MFTAKCDERMLRDMRTIDEFSRVPPADPDEVDARWLARDLARARLLYAVALTRIADMAVAAHELKEEYEKERRAHKVTRETADSALERLREAHGKISELESEVEKLKARKKTTRRRKCK